MIESKPEYSFDRSYPSRPTKYTSTYRVVATDSNANSGYFVKSFMCPTESSTHHRSKPIAYQLESVGKQKKRLHSALGLKYVKRIQQKRTKRSVEPAMAEKSQGSQENLINIKVEE